MKMFFKIFGITALMYMTGIVITNVVLDNFNSKIYCLWFILGEISNFLANYDYYKK